MSANRCCPSCRQPLPVADSPPLDLTARQIVILSHLVAGEANKVIANRLGVTEATVKVHIKVISKKIGVSGRLQAAVWAVTRGIAPAAPPSAEN